MRNSRRAGAMPPPQVDKFLSEASPVDLETAQDSRETWQTLLSFCKEIPNAFHIPPRLIGGVEELTDPELCLAKGDVLVRCGLVSEGLRFLRLTPSLTARRQHAVELTLRAASLDPEFLASVAAGDRARDDGEWSVGEAHYRRALGFYPLHPGYRTQYAHCMKEQGGFVPAESHYRTALALGAPEYEVREHLEFVGERLGHRVTHDEFVPQTVPQDPLDEIPTRMDVEFAFALLDGHASPSETELLELLRSQRTIRGVWLWVIADRRFSTANLQLLGLLSRGAPTDRRR